jgi:putative transposase
MSYVRNWLHCVWGTKTRFPFFTSESKANIIDHIKKNAKEKSIYFDSINGHTEHLHCIISLHPDQSLSKVMQLIKGESSFWINKNKMVIHQFEWADEYYAVSISESQLQKVRNYIAKQEEHHRNKTWQEECDEFMVKYGFDKMKG